MMNDLDEMAAVYQVVQVYFDALYEADATRMAEVMLPAAVYATAAEGDLLHRTQPEYLAVLAKREPPLSATRCDATKSSRCNSQDDPPRSSWRTVQSAIAISRTSSPGSVAWPLVDYRQSI